MIRQLKNEVSLLILVVKPLRLNTNMSHDIEQEIWHHLGLVTPDETVTNSPTKDINDNNKEVHNTTEIHNKEKQNTPDVHQQSITFSLLYDMDWVDYDTKPELIHKSIQTETDAYVKAKLEYISKLDDIIQNKELQIKKLNEKEYQIYQSINK